MERLPEMGAHTEIIFVDGNSTDGTVDEVLAVTAERPEQDIKLIHQGKGTGKGDAPHVILFPEIPFDRTGFLAKVKESVDKHGYCVVVVSEGVRDSEGKFFVKLFSNFSNWSVN